MPVWIYQTKKLSGRNICLWLLPECFFSASDKTSPLKNSFSLYGSLMKLVVLTSTGTFILFCFPSVWPVVSRTRSLPATLWVSASEKEKYHHPRREGSLSSALNSVGSCIITLTKLSKSSPTAWMPHSLSSKECAALMRSRTWLIFNSVYTVLVYHRLLE